MEIASELPTDSVEVGKYTLFEDVSERALVVLSMGLPCWILETADGYSLQVEGAHSERVQEELRIYEGERLGRRSYAPEKEFEPALWSMWIFTAVLTISFLAQHWDQFKGWTAQAMNTPDTLGNPELYRAVTALLVHADMRHLFGNLIIGLYLIGSLLPLFGTGLGWFLVLSSGVAGNVVNAYFYGAEKWSSLGASTSVFGIVGIFVGATMIDAVRFRGKVGIFEVARPLGAGLALFALLGISGENTDVPGHFWGFMCGLILGVIFGPWRQALARFGYVWGGLVVLILSVSLVAAIY